MAQTLEEHMPSDAATKTTITVVSFGPARTQGTTKIAAPAIPTLVNPFRTRVGLAPETIQRSESQPQRATIDRKSTRLNSSHTVISYAVFCLKKKKKKTKKTKT